MNTGISSKCNKKIWFTDYGASRAFDDFTEDSTYKLRNTTRRAQVLEILNNGEQINVLLEHDAIDMLKTHELKQSLIHDSLLT